MVTTPDPGDEKFNGSNWQALNRLVALAKFAFLQDDDYQTTHDDGTVSANDRARCAHLATKFEGPALDWVASAYATNAAIFNDFDNFVEGTRQAFGIADNNITALLRRELDSLQWNNDVPSFFAEFDRLTLALGIVSHTTRVSMIEMKLPLRMKTLLAEQALSFSNYDTMRERFNGMWAMDPTRGKNVTLGKKKPRCGTCGKKGHTASDCRGSKN